MFRAVNKIHQTDFDKGAKLNTIQY